MADFSEAAFLELDLVGQLLENAVQANTHTAQQVIAFVEILERGVADVGSKLEAAHAELARGAQQATVAAYQTAIAKRNTPAYRINPVHERNRRYAGGALLSALEDSSFSVATSEGILFGNTELMDSRAKQWHRLNYGAGSAGGAGARTFNVTWSNLNVASLGLDDGPSPGFGLPRGFWLAGGGGGRTYERSTGAEFYPIGEVPDGRLRNDRIVPNPRQWTRGIEAQRWLDAGVEYIAERLPDTYQNIYRTIYEEAGAAASGKIKGVLTQTVRPWPRPSSSVF